MEQLGYIIDSGEHLLSLIDEVMDLAKIEAGKTDFNFENFDPRPVYEDCAQQVQSLALKNQIVVSSASDDDKLICIWADQKRFRQVLLNLLSNAIKYNVRNGKVEVRIEEVSESLARVTVKDTGPGIPWDRQAGLFEPFNRLGAERTDTPGTGIGA